MNEFNEMAQLWTRWWNRQPRELRRVIVILIAAIIGHRLIGMTGWPLYLFVATIFWIGRDA